LRSAFIASFPLYTSARILGLPAPTQEEAKAFFESLGFPKELVGFRDQFYVVLPQE